jgi:uncharacterized membrane protein (UPF0127 family)
MNLTPASLSPAPRRFAVGALVFALVATLAVGCGPKIEEFTGSQLPAGKQLAIAAQVGSHKIHVNVVKSKVDRATAFGQRYWEADRGLLLAWPDAAPREIKPVGLGYAVVMIGIDGANKVNQLFPEKAADVKGHIGPVDQILDASQLTPVIFANPTKYVVVLRKHWLEEHAVKLGDKFSVSDPPTDADPDYLTVKMQVGSKADVHVELLFTRADRKRGYQNHKTPLTDDEGKLFVYPSADQFSSFWMKECFVPISIIFLNGDGKVLRIHHRAEPEPYVAEADATDYGPDAQNVGRDIENKYQYVLEVAPEFCKRHGIAEGDRIELPKKDIDALDIER